MPKRILLLFFVFCSLISFSQSELKYFDRHWVPCDEIYATYVRHAFPEKGIFRVEDHFKEGGIYCKSFRTEIETNQVQHRNGPITFFDSKGHKLREGTYVDGKRDGKWKYYDAKTHRLKGEVQYEMDSILSDTKGLMFTSSATATKGGKSPGKISIAGRDSKGGAEGEDKTKQRKIDLMPNAEYNINEYLADHINYPMAARKANIEGRAIVKFVIDEDGGIAGVTLLKGIGRECDEEAIRVVSEMPHWLPGMSEGEPVRVYFTLPITFRLTD